VTPAAPLRVRAALGRGAVPAWQRASVDALRAMTGVVVDDRESRGDPPPDLIVDFSGTSASTVTAATPRLGVWRYGFGDGAPFADGAAGTIARLYRATPDVDRAAVLCEGWYKGRSADAVGTRDVGDRVAPWCARVLGRVLSGAFDPASVAVTTTEGCRDPLPPAPPSLVEDFGNALRRWRRRERWTIGVAAGSLGDVIQRGRVSAAWLVGQPLDRFYADPFPIGPDGDGVRLLAEEYRYRAGRGTLVDLTLARDGTVRASRTWLATPGHLSYPFLLRAPDGLFCVPEAASTGRVAAYSVDTATAAAVTLIDGVAAADATIVEHEGRWFLFCTNRDDETQTDLHVFVADGWRGPWTPHPLNPVKSDARSSRPGGALFTMDGRLYRPAQNCSRRYGGGLTINRVLELSPTRFREEPALKLGPDEGSPWPDGLHTINGCGAVTLVDGLRVERA
jgi:hypothetical protein